MQLLHNFISFIELTSILIDHNLIQVFSKKKKKTIAEFLSQVYLQTF